VIKKILFATCSMILAAGLLTPTKANAQVAVRVAPRPYVYIAPPVVAYGPGYYSPNYYPGRVFIGGRWVARPYGYHYGPRYYGWRR
jgi:hypothetical protein